MLRSVLSAMLVLALPVFGALVVGNSAQAQGWGNLKGQFIFDGTAPAQTPLAVTGDKEYCGPKKPLDESIVVGPKGGIRNILVYIVPKPDQKVPVHPSYEEVAKAPAVLDNKDCHFIPHVSTVWTKQKFVVKNSDEVGHNSLINTLENKAVNPIIPPTGEFAHAFTVSEKTVTPVTCSIHPWMKSYVIVRDHPYMAVTDADGKFEIKNLPEGEWTIQVWQEKAGYLKSVTIGGKKVDWKFGRSTVKITPAGVDLGEVKVNIK